MIIERVGRKPLLLWCSAVEIVSMVIIGGLASGPQIAPTVPPKAYGEAAIAFIVRPLLPIRVPPVLRTTVHLRVRVQHVVGALGLERGHRALVRRFCILYERERC
jgi:hypothetical protein